MKSCRARRRSASGIINFGLTPLTAAVLTALYSVNPVLAQEQASDEEDVLEEVTVTGTLIRRKDTYSSASPVDLITTDIAAERGITDLATLLQTATVAQGSPQLTLAQSGIYDWSVGSSPGGLGATSLSLRGLGANRTLILLNGRRVGPSGVQGSVSAFDLNAIPMAAVERVEILKDGASTLYGSDAVAGVVNIITKDEEGGTVEAFLSQPGESGGEFGRLSASWGKSFERGHIRATADYSKQKVMRKGDRDHFKCDQDYVFDPATGQRADLIDPRTDDYKCWTVTWGHVWVYDYAEYFGDGTTNVGPPSYLLQYDYNGQLSGNGLPPLGPAANPYHMSVPAGWYPTGGDSADPLLGWALYDQTHPFVDNATFIPENESMTAFVEGEYHFSDSVTGYAEALFNRRETHRQGYTQIWTYVYNYDSAGLADEWGFGTDPYSAGWTGAQWLSPLMLSDHASDSVKVDYTRFVAGLTGDLKSSFLDGWHWDVSFQYSLSDGDLTRDHVLDDALRGQYWRTGSCAGTMTPISNRPCYDINWFDPATLAGSPPQEFEAFLYETATGNTKYTQWSVDGLMSGAAFEMPAGSAGIAFGFQYRYDEIKDVPDHVVQDQNSWFGPSEGITEGDQTTTSFFGEIELPLLADLPGIKFLDLNLSARYTDVDTYGSDTTYKVGLNWGITETFRARSTWGTSFRTPALYELFLADATGSGSQRWDPCFGWASALEEGRITQQIADNCAYDGIPPDHIQTVSPTVLTGGGLGVLEAETSEAQTFGVIWTPQFTDLQVSVDYFDIVVEGEVDRIGGAAILYGCYASDFFPNEPLCELFDRITDPSEGLLNTVSVIRDSYINIAEQSVKGMDISAQWTKPIFDSAAMLRINTQWTLTFEDISGRFDTTKEDKAGQAGYPEEVGNLFVTVDWDKWSFNWGINYVGETSNEKQFFEAYATNEPIVNYFATGEDVRIDLVAEAVMYHNLSVSYQFDENWNFRLGVSNAFDQKPPHLTRLDVGEVTSIGAGHAFYSQYDWLGRRIFANVKFEF